MNGDGYIVMSPSGTKFWPLNPRIEDINIKDIAHHLSNINRFTGGINYSVGQHSIWVARMCPDNMLAALLHDASEAYLCDLPTPLKHSDLFAPYRCIERYLMWVIFKRYGIDAKIVGGELPEEVKGVDHLAGIIEGVSLMPECGDSFWTQEGWKVKHYDVVYPRSPRAVELEFLSLFDSLYYED